MSKNYRDMTDDEIKQGLRKICASSGSDDEVKRRIKEELGCPYGAAVASTSCGPMTMFMVMVYGPCGNTVTD